MNFTSVGTIFSKLFSNKKRLIVLGIILLIIIGAFIKIRSSKNSAPQYQTSAARTGDLVESVSASGTISDGNNISITTGGTGVVKDVFVKNGDQVTAGEVIADLTLDQSSEQKLVAAQSSYQTAKNSLDSANNDLNTLQNTEFTTNQKFINDAVARGLTTTDPTYIEEDAAWLAAEADYKNQQGVIAAAQSSLSSDALALAQLSSTITAPTDGTIADLTITPGSIVAGSTNSSSTTASTTTPFQKLGTVKKPGTILSSVDISEIDVTKVSPGQKATITLDAFPGKTFTGQVINIDTTGVVSSGVTSYPTLISLDTSIDNIYPNMAVNANIITKVDNNVLLVPSAAIQTANGASTVRVLKNNQPQTVDVTVGDSNDTDTEITSGLSEGDIVITGVVTQGSSSSSGGSSPFSGGLRVGGGGGFGGGNVIRGGGGGRGG